jgi:glutaredoxin
VDPQAKVFSLSTCGNCKKVKAFLDKKTIAYEATDIDLLEEDDKAEVVELIRHMNPRLAFPMTLIGDEVILGYKEDEMLRALGISTNEGKGFIAKMWRKIIGA